MTYEFQGVTYILLAPEWLWLLAVLPPLWLPLLWQPQRAALVLAALLRTGAVVLLAGALWQQPFQTAVALSVLAAAFLVARITVPLDR